MGLAGWSMDCESPLEISHEDGSRATGQAAQMVIQHIKENFIEEFEGGI